MDNQFDPRKFSKEQLQQAVACETPEELLDLAKKTEMENLELDLSDDQMEAVAGGSCAWFYP